MTTKLHVRVGGGTRTEVVEFPSASTPEEIRFLLLTAADYSPIHANNISLSLKAQDGSVLSPSAGVPPNDSQTPYDLHVSLEGTPVESTVHKLEDQLSQQMKAMNMQDIRSSLVELKSQLSDFYQRLDRTKPISPPSATKHISSIDPRYLCQQKYVLTEETRQYLKQPTFDMWQWQENEMLALLEHMFIELGVVEEYKIEIPKLRRFLQTIKDYYNQNMYGILFTTGLVEKLKPIDKLILLVACLGHDLDHPGFNNTYQINARTDLAIIYNDMSPLENHHSAVLFTILREPDKNILSNLPEQVYREVRKTVIRVILSTDMGKHGETMNQFKRVLDEFSYENPEHKALVCESGLVWGGWGLRGFVERGGEGVFGLRGGRLTIELWWFLGRQLLQMVLKCSDISNEVRPTEVAEPWVDCLLQEFFTQSDHEKAQGLPTAPFMDREKVTKASAQVGFIQFVMIPLFELLAKLLPGMETPIITPIRESLTYYQNLLREQEALKGQNKSLKYFVPPTITNVVNTPSSSSFGMLHELLFALSGHQGDIFVPYPAPPADSTTFAIPVDFPFLHNSERVALEKLTHMGFLYSRIVKRIDLQRSRLLRSRRRGFGRDEMREAKVEETDKRCINDQQHNGAYLRALLSAMDQILQEYRSLIVETERKVLDPIDLDADGGKTPISYLTLRFAKVRLMHLLSTTVSQRFLKSRWGTATQQYWISTNITFICLVKAQFQVLLPSMYELLNTIDSDPEKYHGTRLLSLLHSRCNSGVPELKDLMQ
ncbi:High affinity cAMP-specific and IBMX-insensitive 3',5'-cyclic phosphodiesterase 9A, partial [Quaeritorhiza haematococci]